MGLITKGMGAILKHAKKGKKLKTVYKVKPSVEIKQFKRSKKDSLPKKIGVEVNRESGKIFSQAGSGINIKYTKKGKPFVPKGTKPSMLTKAKGWSKIVAPLAAYSAVAASRAEKKK
jgi:hypothetical protein